jgi:hypothetical protein
VWWIRLQSALLGDAPRVACAEHRLRCGYAGFGISDLRLCSFNACIRGRDPCPRSHDASFRLDNPGILQLLLAVIVLDPSVAATTDASACSTCAL